MTCIIRDNVEIQEIIYNRFKKLGLSNRWIVNYGRKHGRKFSEAQLSRYLNHGNANGGISIDDLIWLCNSFNIKINVTAKAGKLTLKSL